jgi:tetratricopeptide (TPR) repeat protein
VLSLFREAGDRAGEARTLGYVGLNETQLGRYEQAAGHQQEALVIFRDIGDFFGQARALGNLGWVRQRQGRYQEAIGYQQQALALMRKMGSTVGEVEILVKLGEVYLGLAAAGKRPPTLSRPVPRCPRSVIRIWRLAR